MLVTGSADGTVRAWDVGEDFMPHADEWSRVKHNVTPKLRGNGALIGHCDTASDIATLENTVIESVRRDSDPTPKETDDRCAENGHIPGDTTKGRLTTIARSLRPELLRQAGVRSVWRTARVTAMLDRTRLSLNPAPAVGSTRTGPKTPGQQPLIEVRRKGYSRHTFGLSRHILVDLLFGRACRRCRVVCHFPEERSVHRYTLVYMSIIGRFCVLDFNCRSGSRDAASSTRRLPHDLRLPVTTAKCSMMLKRIAYVLRTRCISTFTVAMISRRTDLFGNDRRFVRP